MSAPIHLLPRDDQLDPLSLTSVLEWVERSKPHRQSLKRPRAHAQTLADLVRRLWPGIDEVADARAITLQDPDAPFSVSLGEDRATVSVLREPGEHEPRFVDTIVQALCRQSGWIAYDSRLQDIVAGVDWRCPGCERWLGVRVSCPSCASTPSTGSLVWAEPAPVLPSTWGGTSLELTPLLGYYGIPARALTDAALAPIEAELTRVVREALGGRTPLEVTIDRPTIGLVDEIFAPIKAKLAELEQWSDQPPAPPTPPPLFPEQPSIGLQVMQCVEVVAAVTDEEREVSRDLIPADLGEMEIGDELMFTLAITPEARARAEDDERRYGFLPRRPWQPGLARPLWAALRPLLHALAKQLPREP